MLLIVRSSACARCRGRMPKAAVEPYPLLRTRCKVTEAVIASKLKGWLAQDTSEPALRDDQDIARFHVYVGRNVSTLDEVLQSHAIELATLCRAHDGRLVAGGEVGETADGNHHIENRHVLTIRQKLWLGGLADDSDL